jgi:hypothetical protein
MFKDYGDAIGCAEVCKPRWSSSRLRGYCDIVVLWSLPLYGASAGSCCRPWLWRLGWCRFTLGRFRCAGACWISFVLILHFWMSWAESYPFESTHRIETLRSWCRLKLILPKNVSKSVVVALIHQYANLRTADLLTDFQNQNLTVISELRSIHTLSLAYWGISQV